MIAADPKVSSQWLSELLRLSVTSDEVIAIYKSHLTAPNKRTRIRHEAVVGLLRASESDERLLPAIASLIKPHESGVHVAEAIAEHPEGMLPVLPLIEAELAKSHIEIPDYGKGDAFLRDRHWQRACVRAKEAIVATTLNSSR